MLGALSAAAAHPLQAADAVIPVPDEYQALYSSIDRLLDLSLAKAASRIEGQPGSVLFGGSALYSNSNSGEVLLTPEARTLASLFLRQLRKLGLTAISFDINYPLLAPAFHPDARTLDAYLAYYKSVIAEARDLGFHIEIESATIFNEPEFSAVSAETFYRRLTWESFLRTRLEMLTVIAGELEPDYFTICNEPDTEARNTGMPVLERYGEMVRYLVRNLAPHCTRRRIMLGAGFGLWLPDFAARASELLDTVSLSILNVHSYPVLSDLIERVERLHDLAEPRGVMLALGETWLYKTDPAATFQNYTHIFARDAYSFWAPLDQKHLRLWYAIANWSGFLFVSPFWTRYFFAYVDHDSRTASLAPAALIALSQQRATQALIRSELTSTARYYSDLISGQ
jgi:sugar phosphate isomerase/epimerase